MKNMTNPSMIVLHCTATPEGRPTTPKAIRRMHVQENGWSDIGYHFIVGLNGELWAGRSTKFQGAHTKGHNNSIGIAYVGGVELDGVTPKDTMSEKQQATFMRLVETLRESYGSLPVHGHCEFSSKACPSFDVLEKFGHEFCLRDDVTTEVDESVAEELTGPVQPLEEIIDEEPAEKPKRTRKRKSSNKPDDYESR
jgi:N-acetylmuramoyl-L-alanine amidase